MLQRILVILLGEIAVIGVGIWMIIYGFRGRDKYGDKMPDSEVRFFKLGGVVVIVGIVVFSALRFFRVF